MSYMFEKEYEATAEQDDAALRPLGHALDSPYHDYLATYRSLGERATRRRVLWIAVVTFAIVLVAAVGVAAYFYVGV